MNTGEIVEVLRPLCKEYDATHDMSIRIIIGDKLDAIGGKLSEGQLKQVIRMLL